MNHYVYLLSSRLEPKYYIGCRSCKTKIGDDDYMGSSKSMSKHDKDNCNKIILKRFDSRKEALAYEIDLHDQFDVANNELFWNRAKQTSTGFDTTGTTVSNEHRIAISNRLKEIDRTDEWKKNIAKAKTGYVTSEETKKKLSKMRKGVPISEEHKKAISDGITGRSLSDEHKRNIGLANKGKKRTAEQRARFSEAQKKLDHSLPASCHERIECPHCRKVGSKGNMVRWHFDNCKEAKQ